MAMEQTSLTGSLHDSLDGSIDNANLSVVYFICVVLALGNAADAIEIMSVGYIMSERDDMSNMDKEWLSAAVFIGMLIGGVSCGIASDRIGRRPCLLFSLGLSGLAGLVSAFTPTVNSLIICRVLGGIGIGGSVPSVFTLGAEYFPTHIRGKLLSLIASFWMVGAIFTAVCGWVMLGDDFNGNKIMSGDVGWRAFTVVCTIPVFSTLLATYLYIPESPRFQIQHAKDGEMEPYEKASDTLFLLCKFRTPPEKLREEEANRRARAERRTSVANHGTKNPLSVDGGRNSSISPYSNSPSKHWCDPFTTLCMPKEQQQILLEPQNFRVFCAFLVVWFTLSFGTYGIALWINTLFDDVGVGNTYFSSLIYAVANLPGNLFSYYRIDSVGRRNLLTWGIILSALSLLGFAFDPNSVGVVIAASSLFNALSVASWNALDCLSVESFPLAIRTSSMGFLASFGRLGAIAAQFVNGSLENNIPILLFVTTSCMLLGGLCSYILPDHSNKPMEDDDEQPLSDE